MPREDLILKVHTAGSMNDNRVCARGGVGHPWQVAGAQLPRRIRPNRSQGDTHSRIEMPRRATPRACGRKDLSPLQSYRVAESISLTQDVHTCLTSWDHAHGTNPQPV